MLLGTRIALGARKPPCLCLECRCRAYANSTIVPACRLSPSLVQVLPIVVPPSSAMLVLCRWNQQRTADQLCHFPAHADPAQGRCKGRNKATILLSSCERHEEDA